MPEESVGQKLRAARQSRGLSLEQISAETHIRLSYLQALEDGNLNGLPSLVQSRGFLRLFADAVGLDPDPLLVEFGHARPAPVEAPVSPEPVLSRKAAPAPQSKPRPIPSPTPEPSTTSLPPSPSVSGAVSKSQRIFEAIGTDLRAQRELLSLPLSDVEDYIHIRSHYLRALEEGRTDGLPSPVQGRGMLANYAHFLNLDADAFLLRFAEGLQARREELAALQPGPATPHPAPVIATHPSLRRFFSVDLLVTGGVIVLLIGFFIWGASQVMALRNQKTGNSAAPNISDMLLASQTVSATGVSGTEVALAAPTSAQAGNNSGAEAPGLAEAPTESPTLSTTLPAGGEGAIQLSIVASQRVWLQVTADGKVIFTGRAAPGSAYTFSGNKQVELLTGNAAALQAFFNQNDLGVLGNQGQVVDLIFSPEGMQTPTASPSATPTQTPPAGAGTATPGAKTTPSTPAAQPTPAGE